MLLQEPIIPGTVATIENYAFGYDPFFQQDGAPPQLYVLLSKYVEKKFPGHWIFRRGHIEWVPRLQELRQLITDVCATITPEILTNVRAAFE